MRKIDFDKIGTDFQKEVDEIKKYLLECKRAFNEKDQYLSNSYEYAIIALYKAFEIFAYKIIVGCINHDNTQVEKYYGVSFGKHISDDMCDFILTKGGYFDFHQRSDLIKQCKQHIGNTYGIVDILKKEEYQQPLDELSAFRNFAAHSSRQSKEKVKELLQIKRIKSIGSYLKRQNRFEDIANKLCKLATEIVAATK